MSVRHVRVPNSRWEAPAKCEQQLRRPLNANFATDEGPCQICILAQKAQPGFAVCGDAQICRACVSFRYLQLLISDCDRGLHLFLTRERKVIHRVEILRLAFLENEIQPA